MRTRWQPHAFRELPPEHNASGQSVHKACDQGATKVLIEKPVVDDQKLGVLNFHILDEAVAYLCLVVKEPAVTI